MDKSTYSKRRSNIYRERQYKLVLYNERETERDRERLKDRERDGDRDRDTETDRKQMKDIFKYRYNNTM